MGSTVIGIDTNLLVYSHRREMPHHDAALALMRRLAGGTAPWAIPWPCLAEFYSIVTNKKLWQGKQSSAATACKQMRGWISSPSIVLLSEIDETFDIFESLATKASLQGGAIHDARIAALCISHDVESLWTADRDFSRFAQLRCHNPF
jgi:uncharacterized protein